MAAIFDTPAHDRDAALNEGRRIYLGNLLYSAQADDVEDMLKENGFECQKLHISIDPISGRNPGYCFVELTSRAEADRALEELPARGASVMHRPVKVGPCNPKTSAQSSRRGGDGAGYTPTFQRWGDWRGSRDSAEAVQGQDQDQGQGPNAAVRHVDYRNARSRGPDKAQLYIGGLGKILNQAQHDQEMQELLQGFEYVAIGKRITPRQETREMPGNHHYCFVDFSSAEEAERAMKELHGRPVEGGNLRVSYPRSKGPASNGQSESTTGHSGWRNGTADSARRPAQFRRQQEGSGGEDGQEGQERPQRREPTEKQRTIMSSNNWRMAAPSS